MGLAMIRAVTTGESEEGCEGVGCGGWPMVAEVGVRGLGLGFGPFDKKGAI